MNRPNLRFTPDHLLTVRTDLLDGEGMNNTTLAAKLRAVDDLAGLAGASAAEEGDDAVISVPIDSLPKTRHGGLVMDVSDTLLTNLIRITPFRANPVVDRFLGMMHGGGYGPRIAVYRSAQEWLDTHQLTEDEAMQTLTAMHVPYDTFIMPGRRLSDAYYMPIGKGILSERNGISLTIKEEKFGRDICHVSPDLRTLGSCACLGAIGTDRTAIETNPNRAHLYNMTPHNVDNSRQTLSFILGVGALADLALSAQGGLDTDA